MRIVMTALLLVLWSLAAADSSVRVMALFSGKAMLQINGQNHIIKQGETRDGVTLVEASGRGATVRFSDGEQKQLGLNQSIQQAYKKPTNETVRIYSNNTGMFKIDGSINGQRTHFLLDTGATFVAMSSDEADRLNLSYHDAPIGRVQTASDIVPVWHIKLDSVKVGRIRVPQVEAVVVEGDKPHEVLLGMSFLEHIKMERDGTAMILEQKFK